MREYVKMASDAILCVNFEKNANYPFFISPEFPGRCPVFCALQSHAPGMAVIWKNKDSLAGLYRKIYKYINPKR